MEVLGYCASLTYFDGIFLSPPPPDPPPLSPVSSILQETDDVIESLIFSSNHIIIAVNQWRRGARVKLLGLV